MKRILLFFFCLFSTITIFSQASADLIIFSYNRPMQLYALLESVEKHVTGLENICIIYRASTDAFASGYEKVKERFPVTYVAQENPPHDFQSLTLKYSFEKSSSEYVLFAVDDIIVKDNIDIDCCIHELEAHNAYGFFLRLGLHLDTCYMLNCPQPVPPHTAHNGINKWILNEGLHDWGYPNTLDMTLYKKSDIKKDLYEINYATPNQMEAHWANRSRSVMHKKGLCFDTTKIINIPLNRVQTDYNNRFMDEYTTDELLTIFNSGYKINIDIFWQKKNKAAHEPILPTFKTIS